jgi:hypothetical protein
MGAAYIIWHNDTTNEIKIWDMNGDVIARQVTVLGENDQPAFVGLPWRIVGTYRHQIFWHNDTTNETQIWGLSGEGLSGDLKRVSHRATVLGENSQPTFVGLPWRIAGISLMGTSLPSSPSIVWHNGNTNETQIWFMNNERVSRRATVLGEDGQPAFVGLPWRIIGTYIQSIFWYNDATGETQVWTVREAKVSRRATVLGENGQPAFIGLPWRLVGVADFNADPLHHTQNGDPLWHNDSSSEIQIWMLEDDGQRVAGRFTVRGENSQPIFVGAPWRIVASGNSV